MKWSYGFLAILISLVWNVGQTFAKEPIKNKPSLKNKHLEIIYNHCSNPDIIHIEVFTKNYLEVTYLCSGKQYEIGIKDQEYLFLEQLLSQQDIPFDVISQRISKKFPEWNPDEISSILTQDTSFIKVKIVKDEVEQNCYFSHDGKWLKIMPIDISSVTDFSVLEESREYQSANYDFYNPQEVYELPDVLREVSGIALSSDFNDVFCVQDELGVIFKYHLESQSLSNLYRFSDIGDFEDLTLVNDTLYILRSDGNLFIYDLKSEQLISEKMLPVKSLNIEGLSYFNDYLYIACKDVALSQNENERIIYRAPLHNLDEVEIYLETNRGQLLNHLKNTYPEFVISGFLFNPSAVAVHPITKDVYVLSATDRYLAVYREKELLHLIPLSAEVYYKPEGLSFNSNGDLYISSEGDKRGFVQASINLLSWKPETE